ncbi:MAG: hypothetical protein ACT4P5_01510 [Armatimonadota bacterium]
MTRAIAAALILSAIVIHAGGTGADPAWGLQRPDLSRVRVLAIAPFADEVALSRAVADWGAARLSELAARGSFQVVSSARVAEEMKRLGIGSRDLISPTQTVTLGRQVGADAVLTGRVTHVLTERDASTMGDRPFGPLMSRVDVDVRVLEVSTRLILFQDSFICQAPGVPVFAMDCVVRDVAARLAR